MRQRLGSIGNIMFVRSLKPDIQKLNKRNSAGRILVQEQTSHRNVSKRYAPMEDNEEFGSFNFVSKHDPKED